MIPGRAGPFWRTLTGMSQQIPPEPPPGQHPAVLIVLGAIIGIAGGWLSAEGNASPLVTVGLIWLGGIVVAIGVIAAGVSAGMERAAWMERTRR